jgi:hypothetical protein
MTLGPATAAKERAKQEEEMRLKVLLMKQQRNKSLKREVNHSFNLYTDKEVGLDDSLLDQIVEAVLF